MTPLDNLVSAFECLWEAKVYLARCCDQVDPDTRARLQTIHQEVAHARNQIEKLNVELQEKLRAAQPTEP